MCFHNDLVFKFDKGINPKKADLVSLGDFPLEPQPMRIADPLGGAVQKGAFCAFMALFKSQT